MNNSHARLPAQVAEHRRQLYNSSPSAPPASAVYGGQAGATGIPDEGELGELQSKLGERQSSIRTTLPDLTRDIERLKQKMAGAGTSEELGELQAMLGEIQAKIGDQQSKIGEQQAKIGDEQAKLGEQQAKLGERQAALGEQQEKLAEEAGVKLKALWRKPSKRDLRSRCCTRLCLLSLLE